MLFQKAFLRDIVPQQVADRGSVFVRPDPGAREPDRICTFHNHPEMLKCQRHSFYYCSCY